MSLLYTAIILFLIVLALFLGQIAIQFIKLEHKVEQAAETLEEELIDVFGMQPMHEAPEQKRLDKPSKPPVTKPVKKPAKP